MLIDKMPPDYKMPNPTVYPHPVDANFDERATYYFSKEQQLKLEVLMLKLRTECELKVGKSELMRDALDFIVDDFNLNGKESWIYQRALARTKAGVK